MKTTLLLPALAIGLAASLPAWACQGCDAAAATAAPATTATAPSADAMTVVRDAETGRLRGATPAEIAELLRAQPQTRSTALGQRRGSTDSMLSRRHPDGATSTRMTNEMISYAVVTRQADGSLAQQCLDDGHAAEGAVHSHALPQPAASAGQAVAKPAALQLK